MSFRRNKIKGISFHHRTSQKGRKQKSKLQDFFDLDSLYVQIKNENPQNFTRSDIQRFLRDHGRNEINSQISRCIDFSTKWTGILKVVERCFPDKCLLSAEYLVQSFGENAQTSYFQNSYFQDEIEIYLLIKKLIWLWKHNLNILEMTAQAQYFVNMGHQDANWHR
ncbi:MAG: hypothetical protein V4591_00980 [Bdellovibrionota bacterium]